MFDGVPVALEDEAIAAKVIRWWTMRTNDDWSGFEQVVPNLMSALSFAPIYTASHVIHKSYDRGLGGRG